jgi:hypothetical protein
MSLIGLLIFIIIVGLLYWCVTLLPIPQPFKNIALVIVILICIIFLLNSLGVVGTGPVLRVR